MNLTETHLVLEREKLGDLLLKYLNLDFYTGAVHIATHTIPISEEFRQNKNSGKKLLINITTSIVE